MPRPPNPDLDPVDMLTEHPAYQRLADGSPVVGVLAPFDTETLAARGVPLDMVGDLGALMLPPGYLREKGLGAGDVLAVRVTAEGLTLESIPDEKLQTPPAATT